MGTLRRVVRRSWSETFEIFELATSGYFGLSLETFV